MSLSIYCFFILNFEENRQKPYNYQLIDSFIAFETFKVNNKILHLAGEKQTPWLKLNRQKYTDISLQTTNHGQNCFNINKNNTMFRLKSSFCGFLTNLVEISRGHSYILFFIEEIIYQ